VVSDVLPDRRAFLSQCAAGIGLAGRGSAMREVILRPRDHLRQTGASQQAHQAPPAGWHMPAEWEPHRRCWMSYPNTGSAWESELPKVRADVLALARAIRQFEPVTLILATEDAAAVRDAVSGEIELLALAVNDLWMRDIGPTFLTKRGEGVTAALWRFNVWGEKFPGDYEDDRHLNRHLVDAIGTTAYPAPIVTEGGALMVDGEGTLLTTESAILNDNRNPGLTKMEAERIFQDWLGVTKVIWLPGSHTETITDGHIDGFACFSAPAKLLAELPASEAAVDFKEMAENLRVLQLATDAKGRDLEIGLLRRPSSVASDSPYFCDSYVNFYIANGGIVMPRFGEQKADTAAAEMVARAFSGRQVVQIAIDAIAAGGGGIHCSTQQQPIG
jgi:agmatine deiminase